MFVRGRGAGGPAETAVGRLGGASLCWARYLLGSGDGWSEESKRWAQWRMRALSIWCNTLSRSSCKAYILSGLSDREKYKVRKCGANARAGFFTPWGSRAGKNNCAGRKQHGNQFRKPQKLHRFCIPLNDVLGSRHLSGINLSKPFSPNPSTVGSNVLLLLDFV
jgi:hypothetical protein